ncbi:fumarylacetoacetate hydrolase family protein [Bacillaceae bacterium]
MRLVTFSHQGITRIGSVVKEQVVDLHGAYKEMLRAQEILRYEQMADAFIPRDMVGFLQGGEQSLTLAKEVVEYAFAHLTDADPSVIFPLAHVHLEAPVQKPEKIVCVGHNYREHILEMKRELPPYPVIFAKFPNTLIGPYDDIPYYPISEQLDYEAEFAFVIGKRAKNVSEEEALQYVAGYTIANDVSYRDLQRRTLQWLQGKTVDGSAPMGPWIVTKDELPDPSGLELVLTVNGEERQRSNTRNLVFTVPYLVSFLSSLMTLEPGDIVLTGTPGGVGVARDPQVFLQDGDLVRIEIDKIGYIENRVKKVQQEGV